MLQCCVLIAKAQKHDMSNQMKWMKPNSVKLEGFLSLALPLFLKKNFDDVWWEMTYKITRVNKTM